MKGTVLSKGIGIGKPFMYQKEHYRIPDEAVKDKEMAIKRYEDAVIESIKDLEVLKQITIDKNQLTSLEVLNAHSLMLNDPELKSEVIRLINDEDKNVYQSVELTKNKFMNMMLAIEDSYFQERAHDIDEICTKIINKLLGIKEHSLSQFDEDVIIIAHELLPGETAGLDTEHVKGLIMAVGGQTSHSAIIANNLGIPAMVIPTILSVALDDSSPIVLDCLKNQLSLSPDQSVVDAALKTIKELDQKKKQLMAYKDVVTQTLDGKRIQVLANISSETDLALVLENGAEGIGLFRTEFIYMDSKTFPTEEEQFKIYKNVLEKMKDKPVIIRTFDIGGDKNLPYYPLPVEENPFMGYRAIRISLEDKALFKTQLRAILRASHYGYCKIMFPMIASIDEVREAKDFTAIVMDELRSENIPFDESIQLGIMVEIPSVAACAHLFATEVDFFSIGSNDLTQYTLAADRMNEKVSKVYNSFNPGVIQLIRHTIISAVEAGIEVGMCGEIAGEPKMIPLLVALGINELSMSSGKILEAKNIVSHCDLKELGVLSKGVNHLKTASEIEQFLEKQIEALIDKGGNDDKKTI